MRQPFWSETGICPIGVVGIEAGRWLALHVYAKLAVAPDVPLAIVGMRYVEIGPFGIFWFRPYTTTYVSWF